MIPEKAMHSNNVMLRHVQRYMHVSYVKIVFLLAHHKREIFLSMLLDTCITQHEA